MTNDEPGSAVAAGEAANPKSHDFVYGVNLPQANLPLSPSPPLPLSPQGPQYWRSLDELADTEEFRHWLHREFPREAAVWDDRAIDRRRFLQVMAASLALASVGGGCSNQGEERILPYVRAPEGVVPGKPRQYATAIPMAARLGHKPRRKTHQD
jgi:MoCo/4Fe-4S cofactor protein with predicted Tat translocation signal